MFVESTEERPGVAGCFGLIADNDPVYPSLQMNMNASCVVMLNPATGLTRTFRNNLAVSCFIHGGPQAHGRDRAAPFVAGDEVWFYYIFSEGQGIWAICSANTPKNGGPVLPAGFTHFAPAFVVPMVGGATLQPAIMNGAPTTFQVRGNKVMYPRHHDIIQVYNNVLAHPGPGAAPIYHVMGVDLSDWVPSEALTALFILDAEMQMAVSGIAGGVAVTSGGEFYNISLYPPVNDYPVAMDCWCEASLRQTGQYFYFLWLFSSGTMKGVTLDVFIAGYTFDNTI